jgi:thiol-disulfide isomerase/thioredoxin
VKPTPLLLFAALSLALQPLRAEPRLKVGDPAPLLKAAKWFKGGPVEKFDSNLVYVVEFWATWCAPCKKNIPHLTELAKKFDGRARVIGFSIWEVEKTDHVKRLAKVGQFVEEMGDKMDYLVAADDNESSMARNWMEAAGEGGIPTAFIVGRDGRIAWIGYPWAGLDERLEQTVTGTLDTKAVQAEAAKRQAEKDAKARQGALLKPVLTLQEQSRPAEAVAALDQVIAEHPELAAKTEFLRYKLLLAYDEPAAYTQARKLLEGELKDNPGGLYSIARDLTDPPGRKTKDLDLAFDVSRRACELSQYTNPSYLSTLAESYFGKGEFAKAIETEEKAIRLGQEDTGFAASLKYLQRRLEAFKTGQKKAAGQSPGK